MLRIPGMTSNNVPLIVALDAKMLSWFDLLLCANHTQVYRDHWHIDKNFMHGCRCTAAAVPLLPTELFDPVRLSGCFGKKTPPLL